MATALDFRGLQRCNDYRFRLYDYKFRLSRLQIPALTTTNFSYYDYRFRLLSTGIWANYGFLTHWHPYLTTTNSGYWLFLQRNDYKFWLSACPPSTTNSGYGCWPTFFLRICRELRCKNLSSSLVFWLTTTNSGYSHVRHRLQILAMAIGHFLLRVFPSRFYSCVTTTNSG